jgi:hypothetical protein
MNVQLPRQVAADHARVTRSTVRARSRAWLERTVLALAACFAFSLLILDEPARRRAEIADQQALAACGRVYDEGACTCAIEAIADGAPGSPSRSAVRIVLGGAPADPAEAALAARGMQGFVQLVQACMARQDGAPID